jgi:holliday junction DNA helicase RuvA
MIAYLKGQIKHRSPLSKKDNSITLSVGDVGYKVSILATAIGDMNVDDELELFVYTQVAETALSLYGFKSQDELNFFELLISINGIGPKGAMDILNKAKVEDIRSSVETGDYKILSQVSGIGPKTADKIVAGLKNKIGSLEISSTGEPVVSQFSEALEALIGLGYQAGEARRVLGQVQASDVGEQVREALKLLSK